MWKFNFRHLYKCSCYSFLLCFPHEINMLFPRHYWIFLLSSTYVDIVVRENLFRQQCIRKMLKEAIYYPQNHTWIFKGKFNHNNKISFTSEQRHLFPPYFAFYRGFYTSIVEKNRPGMKNGQNAYSAEIGLFYSHFYVDCPNRFFNNCE